MQDPYSSATADAGESLYRLVKTFEDTASNDGLHEAELEAWRSELIHLLKGLCAYVTAGDKEVSLEERVAIDAMFWQDTDSEIDYGQILQSPGSGTQLSKDAIKLLKDTMSVRADHCGSIDQGQYDPSRDTIISDLSLVLQTALAADSANDLELSRLTHIVSELRQHATSLESQGRDSDKSEAAGDPAASGQGPRSCEECLIALHRLVGLDGIKHEVESLTNLARIFGLRRKMGLPVPDVSFHLVFLGNPGTGKSTVARIVSGIYCALGLLPDGHLIEVDRSSLVGGYVGQTATKTQAVIAESMGGVLFIDEAYALSDRGDMDYGQEAIETLLKAMEDKRDEFIVIAAGYPLEMEKFLASNPGLRSRFTKSLHFEDYNKTQMAEIFQRLATRSSYEIAPDGKAMLETIMSELRAAKGPEFANARDVRNLFEQTLAQQANRLSQAVSPTEEQLCSLAGADLLAGAKLAISPRTVAG